MPGFIINKALGTIQFPRLHLDIDNNFSFFQVRAQPGALRFKVVSASSVNPATRTYGRSLSTNFSELRRIHVKLQI